jgi:hypothetical protein
MLGSKKWRWIYSVGGFTGRDTIRPNNSATVTFFIAPKNTYSIEVNGLLVSNGKYSIRKENQQEILELSNQSPVGGLSFGPNGVTVRLQTDTLVLMQYKISEQYTHIFK